jgi:YidC/Oxa1 family membrane protein insertase
MELSRIRQYDVGLYDMVDYGWDFFETVTRPLAKFVFVPVFDFLHTFIPSWGLVIIVFSILVKLALYPLTKSSFTSMAKMRELQPRMEAIKAKHPDSPQKQQEAMMKMYKETGVNPVGGCLPMLLQYPIIIALWQFLPQAIEIRQQGFLWATDLSAPDVIFHLPFTIPFYGDFVSGFTILMGISMVFQMRLQASPSTNAQAKIFTYVFPVMIFVIFNRLAAGLNLYYLCYNVLSAAQQQMINRNLHQHPEQMVPVKATTKSGAGKSTSTKSKRGKR